MAQLDHVILKVNDLQASIDSGQREWRLDLDY